ncbi:hypothetical protein BBK82_08490 [Lentzea guizhouensis]|uniref:AbiEi antitoxin C-terminal domain-containing protein n=1 Tax=Lentzea guizhouensis TaxID=1586287 RepID=A0A1B2HEF2_9PSEU|nr:hypothetical protein [Lentzea guizhouensis]ANZ36098.1 hypothetical protein BBK82_08490 [Lentzea guizhouensis]
MTITTTTDLRKSGFSSREILRRCLPTGPWQLLLPGVVLQKPSPATRLDRLHAALSFAGTSAVITAADALSQQGAPIPLPRHIHVLAAQNTRRTHPGLLLERTARPPTVIPHNGLRLASPPRATLDLARRETNARTVIAAVEAVLSAALCTPADLHAELQLAPRRGTALIRQVLQHLYPLPSPPPAHPHA